MTRFRDPKGNLIVKGSKSTSKSVAKTRQSKKAEENIKTRSVKRVSLDVLKKNPIKSTRSAVRRLVANKDRGPSAVSTEKPTKKVEKNEKTKEIKEKPKQKEQTPEKKEEIPKASIVDLKQKTSKENNDKNLALATNNKKGGLTREERIENRNKIKEVIQSDVAIKNVRDINKAMEYPKGKVTDKNPSGKRWFTVGEDYQIFYKYTCTHGLSTLTQIAQDLSFKLDRSTESIRDRLKTYIVKLTAVDELRIIDEAKKNPNWHV